MELTQRQYQLVQCFSNNEMLTSTQLSSKLGLSSRTIREEIKNINILHEHPLIIATKSKGYQLNTTHPELSKIFAQTTQSSEYINIRNTQILKEILANETINYYDLAESFYISESTLDKIINSFNEIIHKKNPNIQIQRKNNEIVVPKDEHTRREIFSSFLIQEIHDFNFNIRNYESFFSACDLAQLTEYVRTFNDEHHLLLRDFEIFSFVLHIAIMIERINKKYEITEVPTYQVDKKAEYLATQFYEGLNKQFAITFPEKELLQLSLLFSGKISKLTHENMKEHTEFIQRMILKIDEIYNIDLSVNQTFKDNLLVHLLGLETRINTKSYLTNPLIKDIKTNFPLLYDISVFMALQIQEKYKCVLLEDEIGYLTLHLMSAMDRYQARITRKIICISSLGKAEFMFMKQKLMNCSDKLLIQVVDYLSIFEADKCKDRDVDLIISTIPLSFKPNSPLYVCDKILNDTDLEKIRQILLGDKLNNASRISKFFDEDLFFASLECTNEKEVIHILSQKLLEKGYCHEDFESKVLSRETVAPTTYGNLFAIPHPIEKCATQNIIAIGILKNPIYWQGQKTKLVLLFALSPQNDPDFDEIFESLVTLLNDINIVKELLKQESLSGFLNIFANK